MNASVKSQSETCCKTRDSHDLKNLMYVVVESPNQSCESTPPSPTVTRRQGKSDKMNAVGIFNASEHLHSS
jgi:hypothetical protein